MRQIRRVKKRNGQIVNFDRSRIERAVSAAFNAAGMQQNNGRIAELIGDVIVALQELPGEIPEVEQIQDTVEKTLVNHRLYEVSKRYIIYRQKHAEFRKKRFPVKTEDVPLYIQKRNDRRETFNEERLRLFLQRHASDLNIGISPLIQEISSGIFDGIQSVQVLNLAILTAAACIERDPEYDVFAARLLRYKIFREIKPELSLLMDSPDYEKEYRQAFIDAIQTGVAQGLLPAVMEENFDLNRLADSLIIKNDNYIRYLGMQSLYSRYLLRINRQKNKYCIETIQSFWMRIAMGLAQNEDDPTLRAVEFYRIMSALRFVPSTPTLFHSGLMYPQLSSCYVTTVDDDLNHIFKCIGDNAQLSKWSGGVGNDWSNIRGTGSIIRSTKVQSQGVIPFLKIANDTTVAINRSGKRRGATCAYLETWHYDIEEFVDLRKNTGDDRRRTHDMSIAVWIPDLFMKRIKENAHWTLFSPEEVPDLHDLYGSAFEERYSYYEAQAKRGQITLYKQFPAVHLWRKILTRLFETGHPWLTFKDPCNVRSPQDHVGVIHSSNLCTEITLNTSAEETAVCNLGSINLRSHCSADGINEYALQESIRTAIRMLDNVIDINFYPTAEAAQSNQRHRPIGLGLMGLQDALYTMRIPMDSDEAVEFSDKVMETISYYAILSSSELAADRGSYESFSGSKWDRNILPIDTIALLEKERNMSIMVNREQRMDWTPVRESIAKHGMRNSNTMAIAPTATISNIAGCFPCNEPIYKNVYVKSNMSGEFIVINHYLIDDLKQAGLWNDSMLEQLKYYDGNISMITNIPPELKRLYKEAFDIDAIQHLRIIAVQGKWIDQSQSHNIFLRSVSGKKLHEVYMSAWEMGLKTTYYLRTLGATQIEKSTLDANKYGYTQKRVYDNINKDRK